VLAPFGLAAAQVTGGGGEHIATVGPEAIASRVMNRAALAAIALVLSSTPAFALRHCVDKAGREIELQGATGGAVRKQCRAAGGHMTKARPKSRASTPLAAARPAPAKKK